jgi:uncharacterized protein
MTSAIRPLGAPYEAPVAHAARHLQPVAPDERIHGLDLLRGWAMFGVLWSNLNDWYGTADPTTRLDRVLAWTQGYLVESRFYTLLCILFGVGFGIQLLRAAERGIDLKSTYYRRSAALLAIGVVHGLLIWSGDILTMYALVSFALVMFRRASTKRVLVWVGIAWLIMPEIAIALRYLAGQRYMVPFVDATTRNWILGHGTWTQIASIRVGMYLDWFGRWAYVFYWDILAMFLAGLLALKTGFLHRVMTDPKAARRLFFWSVVATAVGFAAPIVASKLPGTFRAMEVWTDPRVWYRRRLIFAGSELMQIGEGLAYAALLLLVWQTRRGARLLRPLAATGRMALTTYLTQSVVSTLVFYGYGFRLLGSFGFTGNLVFTLVLFGCQMALSVWWLRRFRFGPVEWLWRTLTYGNPPRMRNNEVAPAAS